MRTGAYLLLAFPFVVVAYQGFPVPFVTLPPIIRASAIAVILGYSTNALLRREGRSIADYRVSFSLLSAKDLLVGFASGFMLFGIGVVSLRAALPFEWVFNPSVSIMSLMGAAIYHLATNACEELAWRGYAFDSLTRLVGLWPSQAIVALVAACFHVVCGWTWGVALVSTTAGSVLFGLVFYRWRSLPAAVGVHSAWNWTRDLLFGAGAGTSFLTPRGTETWTATQWSIAQGILVAVTLSASLLLATRLPQRPSPDVQTA
ncbi:type II CAAX endopeptidase family protein [Opitutus sp. GAS368]|uniref:CPBP family intramembrane glutamic endopeptidase n=1 Tax=Opitutus sp. GAS368 TaxID=1882749 RepID=UPI0012FE79C9|nr:type II CAAX endopeptidase family protein [Opitutus sp. GAS368]